MLECNEMFGFRITYLIRVINLIAVIRVLLMICPLSIVQHDT